MSGEYNTMSMLRLCALDPPKYGWTACGGVASVLEPHEAARRPEAREEFLKRQREEKAAAVAAASALASLSAAKVSGDDGDDDAGDKNNNAASASDAASPEYYTITDPSAESTDPPSAATTAATSIAGSASATPPEGNGAVVPAAAGSGADVDKKNDEKSLTKKITIHSTAKDDDGNPRLDICTYHRGRVGQEPRHPETGELLCDTDPVDTNHHWIPPDTKVKIVVEFPLGDPNEEEYVDSDLEEEEDDRAESSGGKGSLLLGRYERGDGVGGNVRASRSRMTRAGSVGSSGGPTPSAVRDRKGKEKNTPQQQQQPDPMPVYSQVVQWDLSDPRTPTPEEYAAEIACEFGLTFPQTMDLKESIEAQLNRFYHEQHARKMFRAPIALKDPYGGDRPAAQFGPPEAHCGPTLGVPDAGKMTGSSGARVMRRSNSLVAGSSTSKRSGVNGGGPPSSARPARASRPAGVIKPDRRGIHIVPPDQVPKHDVADNPYAAEVMRRARTESCRRVREAVGLGEQVLRIVHKEVCHICHNRKETGLLFHCGRHAYCDAHCAARLSFRAHDYDSKNPTNIPVDYCPVCTLHCTCAKCTRRLEDVWKKMEIQCQQQSCGVEDVVMDNLYELCSTKLKNDRDNKSRASASGGTNKKRGPKKAKAEVDSPAATAAKGKRGPSDGEDLPRQSNGRFASPSSDDAARPRKKRKLAEPIAAVPVLKVPPSDFPREMHGTEDLDPSTPEDLNKVFTPDGSFPVDSDGAFPADSSEQKFQEVREVKAAEGNFFQCAVCERDDDGEFICCKRCPRAYHKKCFEEHAPPGEQRRECKWCEWDGQVRPEEDIVSGSMKVDKKIHNAYCRHQGAAPGYTYICIMIGELLQILDKLKRYDYGEIFAAPVDTTNVPDYLNTVRKPMDYGTIVTNLEKGRYSPSSSDTPASSNDGESDMDEMEKTLLKALLDIELVHHNCLLYNARDTPFYRAGEVQASKWKAYFTKHIEERLPENVQRDLALSRGTRAAERLAYGRGRKFQVPCSNPTVRSKALAVFDPDTKRIVKQYTSKTAARSAVMMLYEAGYACEWVLSQSSAKFRIDNAEDPSKSLFGYQWVPTEKLKRGNFKVKPYFRNDDLVSPTPNNIVILKEDTVSGAKLQGFASEESAYQDWEIEKLASFNARVDQEEDDAGSNNAKSRSAEFVQNYLDGDKSINGMVWNRVDQPDNGADGVANTPKSPIGKVVMEEEHVATTPASKGNSEEHPSE